MNNLYLKYINGDKNDKIDVWKYIVLSNNVDEETHKIIGLICDNVAYNLKLIYNELSNLSNFSFSDFDMSSYHDSSLELLDKKNSIHKKKLCDNFKQYGEIPLLFSELFSVIKSVDFRGYFKNWESPILLDSIFIDSVDGIIEMNSEETGNLLIDENEQVVLVFSYDEFTKENISGGGGYGFVLRKHKVIDDVIYNYGKNILFIDYLRLCFKWGGFPNLEWVDEGTKLPNFLVEYLSNVRKHIKII